MKDLTSLVFTGDIGFDKYMDGKWDDEELISKEVLEFLHSGNHVIANVEGALIEGERLGDSTGVGQLLHSMNPKAVKVLDRMRADIWNICNNHIMDAGEAGVAETLRLAELHKAKTIGAGMNIDEATKPLILEEAGGIGLISVGYRRGCKPADKDRAGCFMWNEMDMIAEKIKYVKSCCRWCVMVVHGGEEFTSLPSPYTRDRYHKYLEMGADIVVSHHPHVPMNYEKVGEKIIFYSLGNFIFDTDYQRVQFNTEIGLLVKLKFTKDNYDWEAFGIRIDRETEHIVGDRLPRIFENVEEEEYKLLAPLAAKMLVAAYKRQQIYFKPDEYKDADEEKWRENFLNPKRSGRVEREGLDFQIMYPLAEKAAEGEWKKSRLEAIKEYILEQI